MKEEIGLENMPIHVVLQVLVVMVHVLLHVFGHDINDSRYGIPCL